ncbi:neuropeptide Y receptor Y4 [Takifugu rubripes]|uniref:Npy4r protein n=1 Tax=Takifugu rubripes TaxID=31033 RepID=A7XY84_TAKRU|nr:neuropeptide Y receptor Y4 [Takifugu rubripes]ABU87346.1 Npy4r protein [Takifugu rubripes]|eukprot:NP_001098075.1 neuropeptide Y/peptide YY receptor Npy4r [Takifugu rubripes]
MSLSKNKSLSFQTATTPFLFFNTSNSTYSPPREDEVVKHESTQPWLGNRTQLLSDLALFGHSDQCHMSPVLTTFLILWYGVTMILGLLGNIGLICIITRRKEKPNVTSIFICNLSFSDILVCVFCLPFTVIYTIMDHWVFGSLLCRLVPFIQCVSVTVSVLSLVFIALERHQLIVNPAGWKPTITQAYIALILIWILACFTSSPFLAFQLLTNDPYTTYRAPFSYMPTSPHLEACLEHWPSPQHRLIFTTWLLLFQYCGPLLLVLLCYVRVFVRLRHRKDMLDRARAPECQRMAHSRRINIMLVALITAFAVCWLPLTIFNVVSDWDQEALPICNHNLLFSLCHLLAMSSTCINPIIYGFLNSNFRQEVKDVLLHCRCGPVEEECEHFPMSTVHMEVSRTSVLPNCKNNSV